ncbi:iron-regulated protein [Ophiostoma piceae UAMH 11346]|uniref:Solute carrier family 40 member n=1 Tax=Ophiostoma piceae (strain UAMH 11346) TaxID=1262450 RepID=S3CUH9_OPHP1|nr:iron-regulated protein [Ophiostoma piceae UAMH 11346]
MPRYTVTVTPTSAVPSRLRSTSTSCHLDTPSSNKHNDNKHQLPTTTISMTEESEALLGLDDGHESIDLSTSSPTLPPSTSPSPTPSRSSSSSSSPSVSPAPLYISHFLSTWNTRLFEFAAVLFLSAAFPDTLLPVSVYAVTRGLSAMLFAEAIGGYIDRGDRLQVVRVSIIGQRLAVAVSCAVFLRLLGSTDAPILASLRTLSLRALFVKSRQLPTSTSVLSVPFALAVICACVEKLCATMNLVAVERDWVVVLTENNERARRHVNAQMRRIDLFCKLVGPLSIALAAAAFGTKTAVWATLGMSAVSVVAEYFCIALVYRRVPALWRRGNQAREAVHEDGARDGNARHDARYDARADRAGCSPFASLRLYFAHPAFLPSFSLAMLYLSVLSFSGTMVTFLLASGYTPLAVGLARTASTVFELSATWIAPKLMARIGLVRGGIWSLSWQAIWLTAATTLFLSSPHSLVGATGLAVGVMCSRIGLWGFDLCAQNIVQDEVAGDERGSFSTAEAAFQNLFEVLAYTTTIVFHRPEEFQWPVAVSVGAVYVAAALYTLFVRRRRGHLFHPPVPVKRWLEKWRARQ